MRRSVIIVAIIFTTACGKPPVANAPAAAPAAALALPHTFPELAAAKAAGKNDLYEAGLKALAANGDETQKARALAMLGLYYEEQKRFNEAVASLMQASNLNRDIAPFLGMHIVDSLVAARRYGEAVSIANQIIAIAPNTAASTDARLALPAIYAASGDLTRATTALSQSADIALDEFTERRMVNTADALAAAGAAPQAAALRLRILSERPQGRYSEKLYDQLVNADPSPLLTLDYAKALDLADRLGRVNRYDQALDFLNRIAAKYPEESAQPYFRYVRLRSLFNSRNYETATSITLAPTDPYYLASELLRARAFWRSHHNDEFLRITNAIINSAPASKEATEAKVMLGKYYVTDETDYSKATELLESAIAAGATADEGENLWTLGWTYIVAGRYDDALRTFDRYLAAYPDNDYTTNALFWSAKVHDKLGRTVERDQTYRRLIDLYPYSYYSYRARELTGDKSSPPDSIATRPPFPDMNAPELHETEMQLAIVRRLLDVGLDAEAARELKSVTASAPDDPVLAFHMAELYDVANEPLRAMGTLQRRFRDTLRHGSSGVPHRFWEILYPRTYWNEIQSGAAKANLDPYMAAAIIRQESAFDPTVVSNAGAVGLMQIMPGELNAITAAAGLAAATRADLFDPARNTEIGAAEFVQKLQRMNGNRTLAIASYNAGEEAVGRWIAKTPLDDMDFFIESIPYNETRLYVKNVTRNLNEYRRIYEHPAPGAAPGPS